MDRRRLFLPNDVLFGYQGSFSCFNESAQPKRDLKFPKQKAASSFQRRFCFDGNRNSNFKSRRRRDVEDARGVDDRVTAGVEEFQVHRLVFVWTQDTVAAYRNAHIRAAQRRENGCCAVRIRKRGVGRSNYPARATTAQLSAKFRRSRYSPLENRFVCEGETRTLLPVTDALAGVGIAPGTNRSLKSFIVATLLKPPKLLVSLAGMGLLTFERPKISSIVLRSEEWLNT